MPVFISHSFENKPEFDNIADALEHESIEYWKPESLRAGSPLSDQLRLSIVEAELCVFVATRHSVESSWCGAELGAFWGAGKPVLIYIAEASLTEGELPKQFKGHLTERRISRVVEAVQKHLAEPRETEKKTQDRAHVVGSMSAEELKVLIADAVNRTQDAAFVESTLSRIALVHRDSNLAEDSPEHRVLRELLTSLLSVSGTAVREGAKRTNDWKHTFSFSTDTGDWIGLAQSYEAHPYDRAPIGFYRDCLAWRVGSGQRVEAVALLASVTDHDLHGIVTLSNLLLMVGRGALGELRREVN
jgi:hypothetical protein